MSSVTSSETIICMSSYCTENSRRRADRSAWEAGEGAGGASRGGGSEL